MKKDEVNIIERIMRTGSRVFTPVYYIIYLRNFQFSQILSKVPAMLKKELISRREA
jgi:hypothetical protein